VLPPVSVDPEIIILRAIIKKRKRKKKEINASKIYSPIGKFAVLKRLEIWLTRIKMLLELVRRHL